MSFAIGTYGEHRDFADILEELEYTIRNLDPYQTYEFMRPLLR